MKKTFQNDAKIYRIFSTLCDYEFYGCTVEELSLYLRKLKIKAKAFRKSIDDDMKKQIELPKHLKKYKRRTTEFDKLYEAMEVCGYDQWRIELIKEFQCDNRYELECECSKIAIQRRADKLCISDKTDLNKN
jgi:hypothetical protein